MDRFEPGDALIYSKPKPSYDGGWWEQIPATYCDRVIWKNGPRLKIFITVNGFPKARYVHPLSVSKPTALSEEPKHEG